MTPMPSITIVKTFTYRTLAEEWSNTYHFDNDAPTTQVRWKALADAIILQEKLALHSGVSITSAYGHKAGVKTRDWFYDYAANSASVAGTFTVGANFYSPGDDAAWFRWPTTQFTSRGKPIYLRSYFHGVIRAGNTSTASDALAAAWKTALVTYGEAWVTGFSDGALTHHRAGPNGAIGLTGVVASSFATTRTLERRGKRR